MQECGQPPSELVGEMVRLHFFAIFFSFVWVKEGRSFYWYLVAKIVVTPFVRLKLPLEH